jgi:hypothetical protein
MARRAPIAVAQRKAAKKATKVPRLSAADLDHLMTQARVPSHLRAAFTRDIKQQFDLYDNRLLRKDARSEASQAESLRLVAHTARELRKALASLPPELRLAVEPDYRTYIRKGLALHVVRATARAAAATDLAESDPDARWLADQTAFDAKLAREDVNRASRDLLPAAREPLSLELTLSALIATAGKCKADLERRVSRESSKRRGVLARDELAWSLKVIAMSDSPEARDDIQQARSELSWLDRAARLTGAPPPLDVILAALIVMKPKFAKLAKHERAAESWVAVAFDTAGIRHPNPETNPAGFRTMFARLGGCTSPGGFPVLIFVPEMHCAPVIPRVWMSSRITLARGNQTVDHRTYLRPPKVAVKLGVTIGTLANWRALRIGPPHYRRGGLVLYADDEIDAWVLAGRQSTADTISPSAGARP